MSAFLDTNILVYAQEIGPKAETAQSLVAEGGVISVQVLNELTNVLRRKLRRDWQEIEEVLDDVSDALDPAVPLTVETHSAAVALARDYGLSFYDAVIVASAVEAGCDTIYSEDMQDGQIFGPLKIVNPFRQLGRS